MDFKDQSKFKKKKKLKLTQNFENFWKKIDPKDQSKKKKKNILQSTPEFREFFEENHLAGRSKIEKKLKIDLSQILKFLEGTFEETERVPW